MSILTNTNNMPILWKQYCKLCAANEPIYSSCGWMHVIDGKPVDCTVPVKIKLEEMNKWPVIL